MISEKKKFAISATLVLLALLCLILFPKQDRWWCLLAMVMSFAGDVLLLDITAIRRRIRYYFPLGALFFGIAHICYAKAYMTLLKAVDISETANPGTVSAVCIIAVLLGYFVISGIKRKKYSYLPIVFFYILCIGTAFVTILTYACAVGIFSLRGMGSMLGAIAFLLSDFCLGASRIAGLKRLGRWIWVFYPVGQMLLIVCG